jgi:hypothetical protein
MRLRWGGALWATVIMASCGGRTDLGSPPAPRAIIDAAVADAPRDVSLPPPACGSDGIVCMTPSECCSSQCVASECCGLTLPCPPCRPEFNECQTDSDCCTQHCVMNTCCTTTAPCSATCKLDGQPCTVASDCCSEMCSNEICGTLTCIALGPTQCDACVAQSCCPSQMACEADATCKAAAQCTVACESQGGTGLNCAATCFLTYNAPGQALYTCGDTNCLNRCSFD